MAVPGLVGSNGPALAFCVHNDLGEADPLGQAWLADVLASSCESVLDAGPHQRFIEKVLQHHRRIAEVKPARRRGRLCSSSSIS